jgi:ubiquinone/menaquinone biosynthesis C-methylase UbiE
MTIDKITPQKDLPDQIDTQYDQMGRKYIAAREADAIPEISHPLALYILNHLKESQGKSLVDVGCGGGEDLMAYRALGFAKTVGVDPSFVMVEAARKKLGDDTAAQLGKWTQLPFPDASQDYLIGRLSMHYEEDLDTAYREVARVLKPGGKLILIVAHPEKAKIREIIKKGDREYVHDKVYHNQVPITYPRHKMEEYFSAIFQELFELEDRIDIMKERAHGIEPDQMGFIARRR